MEFQAPFNIVGMRALQAEEEAARRKQQQQNMQAVIAGLDELGAAASNYYDKQNEIAAMPTAVGMMKDAGAIDQDTLERFYSVDRQQMPLIFDLLRTGPWRAFSAGQMARSQASAWAQSREGQPRNRYGYTVGGQPAAEAFTY